MLGDKAGHLIIEHTKTERPSTRINISLDILNPFEAEKSLFYLTTGLYNVCYRTHDKQGRPNERRFFVSSDVTKAMQVFDWREFVALARKSEYWSFILEYSNISRDLFDSAQRNPFMQVPFCLDVPKLERTIQDKYGYDRTKGWLLKASTPKEAMES